MLILFVVDGFIILLFLTLILILLDKTTGRVLVHLDVLRVLASKALFDAISVWRATRQADIDIDRQKYLADFEERTLSKIDTKTAIEMIRDNRTEMRQLK